MVTCAKCQRKLSKEVCLQWVGHNNEGDHHWDCIPCVKKESYLSSHLIDNRWRADSIRMLTDATARQKIECKKVFKNARSTWKNTNKRLGII